MYSIICAFCYILLAAHPAYGYIDPNTTGVLSQLLTPVLMVVAAGFTFFRKQVKGGVRWLKNRFSQEQDNGGGEG